MIVIFLFAIFGMITWMFNPNYNELTYEKVVYETKLYAKEVMNRDYRKKRPSIHTGETTLEPPVGLRPSREKKFAKAKSNTESSSSDDPKQLDGPTATPLDLAF